jgi:hypothetical protein
METGGHTTEQEALVRPLYAAVSDHAWTLLPIGLTLVTYFPITANYFRSDDYLYLYRIANDSFFDYLTEPLGGHLLMARNTVFFLCFQLFGTWAPGYFWVALLTHSLNVWLMFHAVRDFTGSRHLACGTAALWGVSPMHEGSLGWYSVYGHVMAGSVLCALLYLAARWDRGLFNGTRSAVGWGILLFVGATSFGVGLGMAMASPLAAFLLVRSAERRSSIVSSLFVAALLPLIYLGTYALHTASGENLGVVFLGSGLGQFLRLLSFLLRLIADGVTNFLLGPLRIAWPLGFVYTVALATAAVWVVGLAKAGPAVRKRILGCTLLGITCYGAVAFGLAARTVFFPFISVDAPRYHYAGSAGLAVAISLAGHAAWTSPISRRMANALLGGLLFCIVGAQSLFAAPIDHHDDSRRRAEFVVTRIKAAIARTPPRRDAYIVNQVFPGIGSVLLGATDLFPGWAGVFVIYFPDNVVDGKRVFFVTNDKKALASARGGKRTAGLLIDNETAKQRGWKQ